MVAHWSPMQSQYVGTWDNNSEKRNLCGDTLPNSKSAATKVLCCFQNKQEYLSVETRASKLRPSHGHWGLNMSVSCENFCPEWPVSPDHAKFVNWCTMGLHTVQENVEVKNVWALEAKFSVRISELWNERSRESQIEVEGPKQLGRGSSNLSEKVIFRKWIILSSREEFHLYTCHHFCLVFSEWILLVVQSGTWDQCNIFLQTKLKFTNLDFWKQGKT